MADDTEVLDGTEEDEKAPPIRPRQADMTGDDSSFPTDMPPIRHATTDTLGAAPDLAGQPTAPPVMPVGATQQPNLHTAIGNTLGARPDPNAPQYQPIKRTLGQTILSRLAAGMAGFHNPEAGIAIRRRQEEQDIAQPQNKYNADLNDYNQRFNQTLQEQTAEEEQGLRGAQTNEANARAAKDLAPPADKTENPQQGYADAIRQAIEKGVDPAKDAHVQAWKSAIDATQKAPNPNEEDRAIKDYEDAKGEPDTPANRDAARDALKTRDKTARAPTDREEWQKDHPNEPIENYWKAKAGAGGAAKEQQAEESGKAAQAYADDYLKSGKFTGAGDEALMEKYFELAKPSSGFRMTQPQIEMLTKAQDLMNSVVARGKHLFSPEAPYFSKDLREQIVDTMKNLQTARDEAKPKEKESVGSRSTPPKGAKVRTYNPATGKLE